MRSEADVRQRLMSPTTSPPLTQPQPEPRPILGPVHHLRSHSPSHGLSLDYQGDIITRTNVDMHRNLEMLKKRPWFGITIVYNNGRRAILAIEKGAPGERAFQETFAAWPER